MFAKIVQKLDGFRSNWREYQRLRRDAVWCWRNLQNLRQRITIIRFSAESQERRCCINSMVSEMPYLSFYDSVEKSQIPIMYNNYCVHFKSDVKSGKIVPCNQIQCMYHKANVEYAAAADEYDSALARCRGFWGRCVKQNKI